MKTSLTIAATAIIGCLSSSVQAVQYGSDVSSSDYEDFYVRLETDIGTCGASLIGGRYIVTANHCVSNEVDGEMTSGNIFFGVATGLDASGLNPADNNARTEDISFSVHNNNDATSRYEMAELSQVIYNNKVRVDYPTLDTAGQLYYWLDSQTAEELMEGDLAVLVLDEEVEHRTGRLIKPLYDYDTDTSNLPTYTDMTFWGWGKTEDGGASDTLKETTFLSIRNWETPYDEYTTVYGTEAYTACDDSTAYNCVFKGNDWFFVYNDEGEGTREGDSGSPLRYDGAIYGVLNGTGGSSTAIFEHFSLSMDLFVETIGELVYPSGAGIDIAELDSSSYDFDVPIQNFTNSTVTLSLDMTDDSGYFSADYSDCPSTLAPTEGCTLSVNFNESGNSIATDQTATIQLTSNDYMTIGAYIETDDYSFEETTESTESSSSGGGSVGGLGLLLFGFAAYARRRESNKLVN
ncbi:trypsin-like serine protease [Vibrio sp. MA40-2]|uniref:trypsin-like serine protease n=1 Tax=Vibrio sp. MA40-2 TaxID=3391828 RepID=UPI0039A70CAD